MSSDWKQAGRKAKMDKPLVCPFHKCRQFLWYCEAAAPVLLDPLRVAYQPSGYFLSFLSVAQEVVVVGRTHDTGSRKGEGDPRGVDGDPAATPLLCEPYAGTWVHAVGGFMDSDGKERRVAVSIGPEHGTVGREQIKEAAVEGTQVAGIDIVLVCAYAFDAGAGEEIESPVARSKRAAAQGLRNKAELGHLLDRVRNGTWAALGAAGHPLANSGSSARTTGPSRRQLRPQDPVPGRRHGSTAGPFPPCTDLVERLGHHAGPVSPAEGTYCMSPLYNATPLGSYATAGRRTKRPFSKAK